MCVCLHVCATTPIQATVIVLHLFINPSTNSLLIQCKHRFQTIFSKHMSDYRISMHETEHFNDFPLHLGQKLKSFEWPSLALWGFPHIYLTSLLSDTFPMYPVPATLALTQFPGGTWMSWHTAFPTESLFHLKFPTDLRSNLGYLQSPARHLPPPPSNLSLKTLAKTHWHLCPHSPLMAEWVMALGPSCL